MAVIARAVHSISKLLICSEHAGTTVLLYLRLDRSGLHLPAPNLLVPRLAGPWREEDPSKQEWNPALLYHPHPHTHTIVRLSFASLFHILAGQWPSFRLCKSGIYWAFRAKTCHGSDLQIYPNANMNLHSQQISTQNLRNAWMKWYLWENIFPLPVVLPHLFCYERRNTVNSGFLKICLGILCPSAPPDCPAPGAQFSL